MTVWPRRALLGVVVAWLAGPAAAGGHGFPAHPTTIPYFTGSFAYHGKSYTYRMVGSSPAGAPKTTRIGVEIVPLRFVFSNGVVLSAEPEVKAVLNSPLFRPARFLSGFTQYGDAIQRAGFWHYVRHKDWHVHLVPRVLRQVEIRVPAREGSALPNVWGDVLGILPSFHGFWENVEVPRLIKQLHLDPRKLAVFLTFDVETSFHTLGLHFSTTQGSKVWTWVTAAWVDPGISCCKFQDNVEALSHEVVEWQNDPFGLGGTNLVPPWRTAEIGCDNVLEVADAVSERSFHVHGYSLSDAAFLSWFARQRPSIAIKGRYDYGGAFRAPPQSCRLPKGTA